MKLVLFDFDGTITRDDSLIGFIRFAVGDARTLWGMFLLSPVLILYRLKLIPNYRAKERMLSHFFKGMREEIFRETARNYSLDQIKTILRPQAMDKIAWYQNRGDRVVVVSASMECWLKPWCDQNGLELIATKLEMESGVVTGRFLTKNCYGAEKAHRVKENYDLLEYDAVHAYGDSRGDRELLALADERFYKPFRR